MKIAVTYEDGQIFQHFGHTAQFKIYEVADGKVEISTTADNQRVLLLFKDSYANSFVQFLWPYYEKIIMIDPRYYYDSLDPILTTENVTDVLLLYSADTFVTDTSLSDVLEASGQSLEPSPDAMTTP